MPGGAGYPRGCAAAANEGEAACDRAEQQCILAAKGGTGLVVTKSIEQIIAQIDRKRLGLDGTGNIPRGGVAVGPEARFRGIPRLSNEFPTLYRVRMSFLANWSAFLRDESITTSIQRRAEQAFERAQRAVLNAGDDYVAHATLAWVQNLETQRVGTPDGQAGYLRFVRSGEFGRRGAAAEVSLMRDLDLLFGTARRERFKEKVWPGIDDFGFAQPLFPRQVPCLLNDPSAGLAIYFTDARPEPVLPNCWPRYM
jgi:hypothetical protein